MAVPYTFATATSAIPLSQLDANFATAITLGNTAVYLGNTTTSLGNLTLTNVTVSSVATPLPNSFFANSSVTLGSTTVSLGATATSIVGLSNVSSTVLTTPTLNSTTTLSLQTGGTTALNVDASQNVAVGKTPNGAYKFESYTTGLFPAYFSGNSTNATAVVVGNTGTRNWEFAVGGSAATQGTNGGMYIYDQTAATLRLAIDTSGNVGIGTGSPNTKLQVTVAPTGAQDNGMRVTDGTRTIQTNITGNTYSYIGIGASETMLYSIGNPLNIVSDGQPIKFIAGTAERMRILTTGNILSLSGGSTSATGTGIAFPATQSASSDANTLDDYEEGTWTPSYSASSGSMSYSSRPATYTKVGRLVVATCHIVTSANNSLSGNVQLNGLPFASDSLSNNYVACPMHVENVNLAANAWIWTHQNPGTTVGLLRYWANNGPAGYLPGSSLNAGSDIMITFSYMTST